MKKTIPAVFFQKQLSGVNGAVKKPQRLEVFENQLRAVVGGAANESSIITTYSGSEGWADVAQDDDCGR